MNPRRFVAAELGSTALLLSFVQLFLVAAALIATLHDTGLHIRFDERIAVAVAAALALPGINALGASIHNASALLFPGWMTLGGDRKPGFEAMGQVYLIIIVVVVAMAVLLLLPAGAAALALLLLFRQYGYWSAIPAVLAGSAVVAGELRAPRPVARWRLRAHRARRGRGRLRPPGPSCRRLAFRSPSACLTSRFPLQLARRRRDGGGAFAAPRSHGSPRSRRRPA